MNKDNSTIGALILIFNILVSLGIGLISFGILAGIFGIHIWVISISFCKTAQTEQFYLYYLYCAYPVSSISSANSAVEVLTICPFTKTCT